MASRTLNAQALPALEPLPLEQAARLERARGAASWNRGALALDAAMLAAAALISQLTASDAGIVPVPFPWVVVYGLLVVLFLYLRDGYGWRLRISALDDVRTVVVNGKVLMRDRKLTTLNEATVLAEARKLAETVRAAVR